MKEFIRRIVLALGYEIRRKGAGTADPFLQQSMLLSGVSAPVIFDVGANIGTIAEKYRRRFPGATIYAFEPFPAAFKELERRFRGDRHFIACNLALGSAEAKASLRVNAASVTNSLLDTGPSAASFWGEGLLETATTVEVEVATLDEFCRKNGIERIDALKRDTQGTELEILRGAAGLLSKGRIRVIYTEIIVAPTYIGQKLT